MSRAIAVATAKVLLERCQDPALRCIVPTLGWAKILYQLKRRATTTAKLAIPEGAKEELKILFLTDIVTCKEKYNVPESLILNSDQTPSKLIQTSRYTLVKGGSKDIPLAGSSDKRTITATFVISLSGNFLPIQLIYGGKTDRSIPRVKFPPSFSLSANPKHYSNTKEAIKVTNDVVLPYIKRERAR